MSADRVMRHGTEYGDYEGISGELYATDYSEARPGEYNWLATIAAQEGGSICELACGHGRVSLRLARLGYTVVGVDSIGSGEQTPIEQR